MAETKNVLLEKFKNRQSEKDTLASREALRLVNLYRSLSYFSPEFVDKYNQMLLSTSSDVRRLLHTFLGGEEVEDYFEFLQHHDHLSETETTNETNFDDQKKGYLPQPDSDIQMNSAPAEKFSSSQGKLEQLEKEQKLLQEQLQMILKELKKTATGFPQNRPSVAPKSTVMNESYSEILEENLEDKTDG